MQWINDGHYLSHDIVNEIITLMGNTVLRQLLTKIRAVRFFSIMADEMRDISNHEQMSMVIRWVDTEYVIHEGMLHIPDTTSSTLTSVIKDVLIRCVAS